jgi:threonylcarbamoyladenosine tRNA methylthiotransferase MtaB
MAQHISIFPQTPPQVTSRAAKNAAQPPTFAVYTLGCKVNQADSSGLARILQSKGFRRVAFKEAADLYVIDTCTVTSEADKKSRKAAARAQRNNPQAVVAVTGCAATYDHNQFERAAPGALVLSNARKWELPELALEKLQSRENWAQNYALFREQTASEPMPLSTRERATIKIQDGCNHKCSYCIIPSVRGASALKSREAILQEARTLIANGARELTLTGVSMGDFSLENGKRQTRNKNRALCDLLQEVSTLEGVSRVRVSSLDPADVDEEYLQTLARTPRVCAHIHLALQSGSASCLRRMRRRYTPELFLKWARRWREIAPDGGLTTDIIVGFPGETEAEFEDSMRIARQAQFSAIHVFPYSPREGTVAAELPGFVAPEIQKQRVAKLLKLADELGRNFAMRFMGKPLPVLVEKTESDFAEGLTENYLKARVQLNGKTFRAGDVIFARAENWNAGIVETRLIAS